MEPAKKNDCIDWKPEENWVCRTVKYFFDLPRKKYNYLGKPDFKHFLAESIYWRSRWNLDLSGTEGMQRLELAKYKVCKDWSLQKKKKKKRSCKNKNRHI